MQGDRSLTTQRSLALIKGNPRLEMGTPDPLFQAQHRTAFKDGLATISNDYRDLPNKHYIEQHVLNLEKTP
jgi:hypothetical protein